jgi:ribose 5-phosphate isomerase B
MKIAVGADHAGLDYKVRVVELLHQLGHEADDMGTNDDSSVDYTDYAFKVARSVAEGNADRGILICGTGLGMCMAANRVKGVRAALCTDEELAVMSRRHNNANVLCLGGRHQEWNDAAGIIKTWLDTSFEGGRHTRRVSKIDEV